MSSSTLRQVDGEHETSYFKGESGAASLVLASLLAGMVTLAVAIAVAVDIAHTHSRASSAADLAALAGARDILWGDACDEAAVITAKHQAELASCEIEGEDVQVEVRASPQGAAKAITQRLGIRTPEVRSVSRAGPPECGSSIRHLGLCH